MSPIKFMALPSDIAGAYRQGALDANRQAPEAFVSDGTGVPCRHCLSDIEAGVGALLLAHRPFPHPQPYAETGPIFLHADNCERFPESLRTPPMIARRDQMILRGYTDQHRICEGTGRVVATRDIASQASGLLDSPLVSYVHVRSASNNCFQCRIERG